MAKQDKIVVNAEGNDDLPNGFDSKQVIEKNAAKRTVVKYNDRVTLKVKADTRFYKEGQIITPHRVMAEELISQGIAEAYIAPRKEDND